ncbi:hypothetical protein [Paenibacillus vini]|uniref:Phage protein n=1 Tax=Paenibacillus vini TaxID=1476024 RepID=A0ABQ4MD40_9BACL|nr:hypothetical protein [Paenibacillus vini]GIP53906.1 hypothetical protein J42TS3_29410 [Paenibacillus vini]
MSLQLKYEFDKEEILILETEGDSDVEFEIKFIGDQPLALRLKEVQKKFAENDVYTDALFYMYEDQRHKIIVRKEYYIDFIMALMKYQLLTRIEWI